MSLRISFENILIEILGTCTDSCMGDLVTYLLVLVRWTLGQEVWIWDLAGLLCCVPGNRTLLSQCLSPPRSVIGYWGIMREAWWNAGGNLVMDLQPIQEGVVKLPVTSFHHNFNKIWLDKPLGSSTDLTYLSCIKLFLMDYIKWKLETLHEIEGILSLINTFLKLKFHFFKSRFSYILTFTLFTSVEWFTLPDKHCK